MTNHDNVTDLEAGCDRRALLTRGTMAAAGAAALTGIGAAAMPAAAAGSGFTPIRPFRAYDSRQDPQGKYIASGDLWTLGTFTDGAGSRKITSAKAVAFTVTVVSVTSRGFVTVMPGNDVDRPSYSTVNWSGANQAVANSSIVQVTTETIKGQQLPGAINVYCGGGGRCAVLIDIVGYFS